MSFKAPYSRFVFIVALAAPVFISAQSDNFDSGALDPAWKRSQFNPALVNLTFPDAGTGKALRIRSSPVPDAAPAAAMFYREQVYSNFYMAVDIMDWPGTDKNQAIVLVARGTLSANPATTTGIIMNYDASQYGENPTDRRQGQLQINMVTNEPAFGTKTLATAEITFVPGRPYRLVFQGVGSHYTAQAYDWHDLTRPLVTIEADDDIQGPLPGGGSVIFEGGGFKRGVSGFLSFSRQGTIGTTDVTVDNYFVAHEAPDTVLQETAALAHPVPGTPFVVSRSPAARFKNFHNPGAGLSFSVDVEGVNYANAATKLRLNGVEVPIENTENPLSGRAQSGARLTTPLASNTVYSAQIEVQDVTGTKKSTNTFWFDTFSDAYLSSSAVETIEAEEYNYNGGEFQLEPIPVSGLATNGVGVNGGGVGYWEQAGVPEVDYHDARSSPEGEWAAEFRTGDAVGLSAGIFPEISDLNESTADQVRRSDHVRLKYASSNLLEYVVHRTEPGEWLNYTRDFSEGSYGAYLRVASFGATEVELHRVTSDAKAPDQTTTKLGTFRVPNLFTRYNYRYLPLVNEQGAPVSVQLPSGRQTLRLQMAGAAGQDARKIAINYLLFVPQAATPALAVHSAVNVVGPYSPDTSATLDGATRRITIPLSGQAKFFQLRGSVSHRITGTQISGNSLALTYEP